MFWVTWRFIFNIFSLQHYTRLVQFRSMFTNSNKQTMTIKNLINLSSIPKISTLSINLTLQTTSFSLSFDLNMKIDFLNIFGPYTHPIISDSITTILFEGILGIFDFGFNLKIRVWGYFNWGRMLPLIIERIFGNFGAWIKDCKIRVPILYIWGRNSH